MDRYKIIKKKPFQSLSSFEEQINAMSLEGWKAKCMTSHGNVLHVLMDRDR